MIELCDIFSLDSPAKQQVLFVRQPFNLSSFRTIFGVVIFYGSRSDSLKFSVSLSAWKAAEVFSHSLISNTNCLLWTSYLAMRDKIQLIDHYVTYRNEKSTSAAIFIFRREQIKRFSLYKQGTDARRLHYLNGLLFKNKSYQCLQEWNGLSRRHRLNGSRGSCTLSNSTHRVVIV